MSCILLASCRAMLFNRPLLAPFNFLIISFHEFLFRVYQQTFHSIVLEEIENSKVSISRWGKHVSERLIAPYISLAVHTFQTDRAAGPTEPSTESMRTDSKIHAAGQTRRLLDTKIPSRRGAGQPSPGPLM